jgi:Na+/H+-dicarboxylate symporter
VGDWFLRALKMLIVPLIVSSIIVGVASVGGGKALGRLGAKTGGYYVLTSLLAVLTGLFVVDWIEPGISNGVPVKDRIGLHADTASVADKVSGRGAGDIFGVFLRMVPDNVVGSAAAGDMLGLIFFSILFGAFINRLSPELGDSQRRFWRGVNDVMMAMTDWVMLFAPIGVFGLVAKVLISTTGLVATVQTLAGFVICVLLGLGFHVGVTLPVLLSIVGRVNPLRHYRAVMPAVLMAFSTASSSATLPVTMDRVERHAGVSNRVTSFTLPLGATVNMDGTALYECVAALFIAQAYGVQLGAVEQLTVVLVALLTSIGVAGIPSASLVAITLILTTIGLPMEAVGLILAVDRLLDMCRTAVNVLSDTTAAVVIARSEGEQNVLTDAPS